MKKEPEVFVKVRNVFIEAGQRNATMHSCRRNFVEASGSIEWPNIDALKAEADEMTKRLEKMLKKLKAA